MQNPSRRLRGSALALAVLGALAAGQAGASGFQLREQSVRNLGKSNAGSIVGADASHVSLNPAAILACRALRNRRRARNRRVLTVSGLSLR